jgi:GntR family phosphonate transport system transcriptional regulator
VSFEIPPVEALRGLRLDAGVAAWRVESTSRDADTGRLLLASTAWTRADAVRMVVELRDTPAEPDTTAGAGQPRAGSPGAG